MGQARANATAGWGSDGEPCSGGVSRSTRDYRDLTAGSAGSITCGEAACRWNLAHCCIDLQNPWVSNGGRRRPRTMGGRVGDPRTCSHVRTMMMGAEMEFSVSKSKGSLVTIARHDSLRAGFLESPQCAERASALGASRT